MFAADDNRIVAGAVIVDFTAAGNQRSTEANLQAYDTTSSQELNLIHQLKRTNRGGPRYRLAVEEVCGWTKEVERRRKAAYARTISSWLWLPRRAVLSTARYRYGRSSAPTIAHRGSNDPDNEREGGISARAGDGPIVDGHQVNHSMILSARRAG
jgi:hypothetical protein